MEVMQKIASAEQSIQSLLSSLTKTESSVDTFTQSTIANNTKIFHYMHKLFQSSPLPPPPVSSSPNTNTPSHPLPLLLIHLSDTDLLSLSLTCRTLHRLLFSPFGFKLLRLYRPLIVQVYKIQQQPIISISMFQGETKSSKQLIFDNDDEDDLQAAVMAMNTNILAMMHKIKQIERAKKRVNLKCSSLISNLKQQSQLKQELNQRNIQRLYKIQKQQHVGGDCERHIQDLMLEQQRRCEEKEERIECVRKERDKLMGHKELLIKKLKAVMTEAEEEKAMAGEVQSIMGKLEHILKKK